MSLIKRPIQNIKNVDFWAIAWVSFWIGAFLKVSLARVAYVYPPNTRYVDHLMLFGKKYSKKELGFEKLKIMHKKMVFNLNCWMKKTLKMGIPMIAKSKAILVLRGGIYHPPDSPWYKQTMPEVMFCTEEKTVKAGFRPPKQWKWVPTWLSTHHPKNWYLRWLGENMSENILIILKVLNENLPSII